MMTNDRYLGVTSYHFPIQILGEGLSVPMS